MNAEQIYLKLKGEKKKSSTIWFVTGAIFVIGLLVLLMAEEEQKMLGVFFILLPIVVLGFYFLIGATQGAGLKKSLATLEKTKKLGYVNEIFEKRYTQYDKIFVSQHLIYIPGQAVIAIDDIVNLRAVKADYIFDTIDGKYQCVRVAKKTLEHILQKYPQIPVGLPYKSYKDKIQKFKEENGR